MILPRNGTKWIKNTISFKDLLIVIGDRPFSIGVTQGLKFNW